MHTLSPQSDSLSAMSRSACFVLVLTPVIVTTLGELSHTRQTIVTMTRHMESLLPMLLTLLTALGGSASSAFLHPMVAAASGSMVFLAREVILRLVMCTCAVTAVNHLSDRAHLTRMAQLLRGAVCWLLGVSFTVFLGAMSLQGVTSASIDGVAIRAAKYAVDNFVPVVGGMFSDTMDTLVGCTLIVKNALGVAAVLVLVGALAYFVLTLVVNRRTPAAPDTHYTADNGIVLDYESAVWPVCEMTEDDTLGHALKLASGTDSDNANYQIVLFQRGDASTYEDYIGQSESDLKSAYGVISPRKVKIQIEGATVTAVRCDIQTYYAVLATVTYPDGDVVYVSGLTKLASISDIVNLVESVSLT